MLGRKNKKVIFAITLFFSSLILTGCFQPNVGISFSQKWHDKSQLNRVAPSSVDESYLSATTIQSVKLYGPIIQQYAYEYELDWRLVLAVMRQESSFQPAAISHMGAYGLMQLMPTTQEELVEKLGVPEAQSPRYNIQAGIYHLRSLHRFFNRANGEERTKLALAAYNAGPGRILDAQDIATYLGKNPDSWSSIRTILPLMARKYDSFHSKVWSEGGSRSGPFNNSQETINYVDNVLRYYDAYRQVLE